MESVSVEFAGLIEKEVVDPVNGYVWVSVYFGFGERDRIEIG